MIFLKRKKALYFFILAFILSGCIATESGKTLIRKTSGKPPLVIMDKYKGTYLISDVYQCVMDNYYRNASPVKMLRGGVEAVDLLIGNTNLLTDTSVISPLTKTPFCEDMASNEALFAFLEVYNHIVENVEKHNVPRIAEIFIKGMLYALDRNCGLFYFDDFEKFMRHHDKPFKIFLGVQDGIRIVSSIEDSLCHKAGILSNDKVIMIDGESTDRMNLWEANEKILGSLNTVVSLTISRMGKVFDIMLKKDIDLIKSVRSSVPEPGYGYIKISVFHDDVADSLKNALEKLKKNNPLKGIILDLRDNPGGSMIQAIRTADMFIEKGKTILSIRGRAKKVQVFKAENGMRYNYPIVILINKGTASVSEIMAGAFQDHNRAIILGTTSFSSGSIYLFQKIKYDYHLKIAIGHYFTPENHDIEENGIIPDVFFDDETSYIKKAIEILKSSSL